MKKLAIIDDYERVALELADWSAIEGDVEISVFHDHLADEDALAARLADFEIVCMMRERTPFPRSLIEKLPKLEHLYTSGMRNWSLDAEAAREHGVAVTGTPTLGSPLFRAGLDRGDRVLDIGGETFEAGDALQEYLESRAVGDVVTVRFESRGQNYEREMTLGIDPTLAGTLRTGGASTATERDFLGRWKAGSEE